MNDRLIDIGVRRGRLLERIASQRAAIGSDLAPVRDALRATDRAVVLLRSAADTLRRHPAMVLAGVAIFIALKPRRLWRWGRRAFVVWRSWRFLRQRLAAFNLSIPGAR
ncbi:YqjK-like family protein [Rhodocyclus tenuis]|uniref:YqjK-like protein n=1 Tax=Rhodocyclus tenuis TaxID=1066 RepID=A0A840G2B3_RHOTE|nr:YqjK-like family protein [Rhodocyclus tenuis]MBB4246096.1 hypothetical protein [Rhodocyclus tenuis]MBK1680321.1 hypothetical protein [Rhodocyclus tenuis]